jgi:predicted nucleic acid-binding protein
VSGCVLDTDVVIATLDRRDANHRAAARATRSMAEEGTALFLSLMNYAEALVRPAADPTVLRTAVQAIEGLGIELVAPTPAIARDAARLRSHGGISLADCFAIATARAQEATLASFDRRVRAALRSADVRLAPGLPPGRPA